MVGQAESREKGVDEGDDVDIHAGLCGAKRLTAQLVELATGSVLLDATAGSDAGIDVVSSEYATIAAEQKALENLALDVADRIATQVAVTLRNRAAPAQ